ncbi:MAG: ExeA family protein [Pyrinomonadaceae bacterium]
MSDNSYTPFSISPNPNSLYLTDSLRAVVNKSKFTIDKKQGLTCILGDIGLGKSTILRFLHSDYSAREDTVTTLIPTPSFPSPFAMLKSICMDFKLEPERSFQRQQESLESFLQEKFVENKNVIIFVDEAQNVNNKQLELVRSLLNYETNTQKLIQIVLSGQLELKDRLSDKRNKAVASRVSTYSILSPLTFEETREMIIYRCKFENIENPFTDDAVEKIYQVSGGVPRSVLKVCAFAYHVKELYDLTEITSEYIEVTEPEVLIPSINSKTNRVIKSNIKRGK